GWAGRSCGWRGGSVGVIIRALCGPVAFGDPTEVGLARDRSFGDLAGHRDLELYSLKRQRERELQIVAGQRAAFERQLARPSFQDARYLFAVLLEDDAKRVRSLRRGERDIPVAGDAGLREGRRSDRQEHCRERACPCLHEIDSRDSIPCSSAARAIGAERPFADRAETRGAGDGVALRLAAERDLERLAVLDLRPRQL